jgi:hypothetical protein
MRLINIQLTPDEHERLMYVLQQGLNTIWANEPNTVLCTIYENEVRQFKALGAH